MEWPYTVIRKSEIETFERRPAPSRRAGGLLSLAPAAVLAAGLAWGQEARQPGETRIVRAWFDDPLVAARAVISLDALESEYEKGYIVLRANEEDIELARQAGMRIVEDEEYVSVALPSEQPTDDARGKIAGFPCYRTVEGTYASARALVRAHPKLATWESIGKSWKKTQSSANGHDLYVLRLTNSDTRGPKPTLFITAALHAREYATAELALRFAERLARSHETDADVRWLLDHQQVHILLQANPDGRKRAEAGLLWRKNHNTRHCADSWAGVDLNRNFDFKWGEAGASANECSNTYRGPSAGSEPETQTIQTWMAKLFPDARGPGDGDAAPGDTSGLFLDIHSHGRLILWPWGHVNAPAPNGPALRTLGRKLAYFNGYRPLQSFGLYPNSGTTEDYGYGVLGRASITYELGTTFFEGCDRFEKTILNDNLESLLYAFKVARTPYRTPAGPDVRDLNLSGAAATTGVAAGTTVTLSATFDDTRYENGNGSEPTQKIAGGEYYVDVPPWAPDSAAKSMYASDQAFDSATESATGTIDTTGLSAGRHTVFVQARDAGGNRGAVSAVFLRVGVIRPPPATSDDDDTDDDSDSGDDGPNDSDDDSDSGGGPSGDGGGGPSGDGDGGPSGAGGGGPSGDGDGGPSGDGDGGPSGDGDGGPSGDGGSGSGGDGVPRAAFSLDAPCTDGLCRARTGVPVSFEDTSSGSVTSRTWDFGDGSTARGRSPEHVWSAPGFYTVSLTVSGQGRSDSESRKLLIETAAPAGTCASDVETLCLQDSRFSVAMEWWTADGKRGAGKVVHEGTNDSGLFHFFSPKNWELLVKVLDGCSANGHVWVYGSSATTLGYLLTVTDTVTGAVREVRNEPGEQAPAFTDNSAFPASCGGAASAASRDSASPPPAEAPAALAAAVRRGVADPARVPAVTAVSSPSEDGGCKDTATAICLQGGRYEVTVEWSNREGGTGAGRAAGPRTDDSGLFHFFSPANWEVLVKVLDGCGVNRNHWVFAASATDVGFELRVRDTATGRVRQYTKTAGTPARALVDLSAFPENCGS